MVEQFTTGLQAGLRQCVDLPLSGFLAGVKVEKLSVAVQKLNKNADHVIWSTLKTPLPAAFVRIACYFYNYLAAYARR